ncbi:MAG: pseudouridine synthase [Anaerolineales bacterium]
MPEERVQKILAHAGFGSRRACEKFISAGRVTVNGKPIQLGDKADPEEDQILLDGRPVNLPDQYTYLAVYKPRGILSSTQTEHERRSVLDLVETNKRLYPVGRLDLDSEGLMLLTDDGEMANRLTHPRYGHEKEYRVLVSRHPDKKQLETWSRGLVLEDGYRTRPVAVRVEKFQGKGAWLRVTMSEGRKRQIRQSATQVGLNVVKLIRIRIGPIRLGSLKPGQYRALKDQEISSLKTR